MKDVIPQLATLSHFAPQPHGARGPHRTYKAEAENRETVFEGFACRNGKAPRVVSRG